MTWVLVTTRVAGPISGTARSASRGSNETTTSISGPAVWELSAPPKIAVQRTLPPRWLMPCSCPITTGLPSAWPAMPKICAPASTPCPPTPPSIT